MSRSLHTPRGFKPCPLSSDGHWNQRCVEPLDRHPRGFCPERFHTQATTIREGDLTVHRHLGYHEPVWTDARRDDNKRVRRTTRDTLSRYTGTVEDVIDAWLDDETPLGEPYPGLAWLVW